MYFIRHATLDDIPAIKQIANRYKNELGFVNRAALSESVNRHELFVAALQDGQVVGFVNWHLRRDEWTTIYEIAVRPDLTGHGIGRALLYAVPTPHRLKCTVDNPANRFYQGSGMQCVGVEEGRKRPLNVWERRNLYIWVQGNNRKVPAIARYAGMAYGTRHDDTPRAWPFMVDINWKRYDWDDYLHKIRRWRPVMAMVPDYEHEGQRMQLYRQIDDLQAAGVLRVLVCPKFNGAVKHIPWRCVVAVSVPSSYAGFVPDYRELAGRRVHLLGGSPNKQKEMITQMLGSGVRVWSLDGNSHNAASAKGTVWADDKWRRAKPHEAVEKYHTMQISAYNITRTMQRAGAVTQLPLL